jgi:hypothetical protein
MKTVFALVFLGTIGFMMIANAQNIANQKTNQVHIVDFGEYYTKNVNATSMKDYNWTLRKETTDIKIESSNGFGFHFSLPEAHTGDVVLATVTIAGGFGPPGVIGYEAQMNLPVRKKNGKRIGEIILSCGGISPPRPGDCTIRVKLGESVVEKKFVLSN